MAAVDGVPNRSPWIAQLGANGPPRPLVRDVETDVLVVGAGIAGVATAFFVLRDTDRRVLVVEQGRAGHGATGHNAGQLTTYFERPLHDIAAEFGVDRAVAAQGEIEAAHGLLDEIVLESGADVRIERFEGRLGIGSLEHLVSHLRSELVRRSGGLTPATCVVSVAADVHLMPAELQPLYDVVPQSQIDELLEDDGGYLAVVSEPKGCANSAALVRQVLDFLQRRHADRFAFHDHTEVDRLDVSGEQALVTTAGGHSISAGSVVLCTNGYAVERVAGLTPDRADRVIPTVAPCVGFMAAFFEPAPRAPGASSYIRNQHVGGDTPYVYVTHRTYDDVDGARTLTCLGGPGEIRLGSDDYDPSADVPRSVVDDLVEHALPLAGSTKAAGQPFDFAWHGLMGYTPGSIRIVGRDPRSPRLLYNLGCNGVGFLPSIAGGRRIARILAGEAMPPSIFDPRPPGWEPAGVRSR